MDDQNLLDGSSLFFNKTNFKFMKTVEKEAKDRSYSFVHDNIEYSHPNFVANEKSQSFKDGVEFAQRWIPVEEELPEQSQKWHYETNQNYKYYDNVLCKSKNNKVFVARRYSFLNKNIKWNVSSTSESSITHWRPIELK